MFSFTDSENSPLNYEYNTPHAPADTKFDISLREFGCKMPCSAFCFARLFSAARLLVQGCCLPLTRAFTCFYFLFLALLIYSPHTHTIVYALVLPQFYKHRWQRQTNKRSDGRSFGRSMFHMSNWWMAGIKAARK